MNDFIHKLESLMKEYSQFQFQFHFRVWRTEFLRFFRSMTNYNISKEITSASCTLYKGKKSYSFSVDDPTFDKIHKGIEDAIGIIDSLPEDPDYVDIDDDVSIAPETKVINNIEIDFYSHRPFCAQVVAGYLREVLGDFQLSSVAGVLVFFYFLYSFGKFFRICFYQKVFHPGEHFFNLL